MTVHSFPDWLPVTLDGAAHFLPITLEFFHSPDEFVFEGARYRGQRLLPEIEAAIERRPGFALKYRVLCEQREKREMRELAA